MKMFDSVKGLDGILKSCFHCKSVAVSLAEGKAFCFWTSQWFLCTVLCKELESKLNILKLLLCALRFRDGNVRMFLLLAHVKLNGCTLPSLE